ncbi:MAG: tetratricopeptide repeat protein, partial [Alphaproteobacteria bacterium]|nr:tetratricopeptide repeat protein [Alphaproteobacteria bacterium]
MTRAEPPPPAAGLIATAVALHQAGRIAEARTVYERALAATPDDADALYGLGVLRVQEGALDAGIVLLRRTTALRPRHGPALIALGGALARVGRPAEASAAL